MAQLVGLPGLYLASVEALSMGTAPQEYGFDAAVSFAPNWGCIHRTHIADSPQKCCDYPATAAAMLHRPPRWVHALPSGFSLMGQYAPLLRQLAGFSQHKPRRIPACARSSH